MKAEESKGLDFIIDKLTNSIENAVMGDSFKTKISILTKDDILFTTLKKDAFLI